MAINQEMVLAQKFLSESLMEYEPQIMDTVYPEYWAYEGRYHNARSGLAFGAQGFTTARRDFTGKAVNYGGKATTLPLANFGITLDKYQTVKGILAADWTWEELRAEEMARDNPFIGNVNVVESYREALERGLRQWMHYRSVFGDPSIGFSGLVNNPYVEVVDVASGANPLTGSAAGDAADAYDWFRVEASSFKKQSKLTSEFTIALTSEDVRSSLNKRFTDVSGDGTPYQLITSGGGSPVLSDIVALNEFDGAEVRHPDTGNISAINGVALPGTPGSETSAFDLLLMCDAVSGTTIERRYANIETMTPFMLDDGMTFRQIGICATSEVVFSQPFRARLYVLRK